MRRYRLLILWGLVIALLAGAAGAYYQLFLWDECRDAGHTAMYCVHVVLQ